MADHLKPTVTSTYSNFVSELDARFDDLAVGLDPAVTSATNVPTNAQRWTSASSKWEKFNGTSWEDLATTYSISISGNSGSASQLATARNINGVAFNGTAAININLNNSTTFNNSGSGAVSGSTFNGASGLTVSYNTIGAPSVTGTNASGTWAISISGNAATVNNSSVTPAKLSTGGPSWNTSGVLVPVGSLQEKKQALPASNIDLSVGNFFTKTILAGTTFTVSNVPSSGTTASFIIELTDGGSYAITWWANVKWSKGSAPVLTTSGKDVLGFYTHDNGTTWNGLVLAKDMK